MLLILTSSAVVAIIVPIGSSATIALGLSYTMVTAFAFLLVLKARSESQNHHLNGGGSVIYSANGLFSHSGKSPFLQEDHEISVISHVSIAAASATAIATFTQENFTFGGLAYWGIIGRAMGENWVLGQGVITVLLALGMLTVHCVMYWVLLSMVSCSFLLRHMYGNLPRFAITDWGGNFSAPSRLYIMPNCRSFAPS